MKVLITGCSSAQTSESVAKKLPTFTGLLVQALREGGHDVVWDTPTMRWDEEYFSQYHLVIVGLTAPTSVTAHRLYGALSVIGKASQVTNVKYLLDAPEPHKLWNGIRAVAQNPENLVKDFYSRRSEYSIATSPEELEKLQSVVNVLYSYGWKEVIVPSFPWFKPEHITNHIPNVSPEDITPLCLDSLTFKNEEHSGLYMKSESNIWSSDAKSAWVNKISKTISMEVSPISVDKSAGSSVLSTLNKSIGSLISVYKNDEPWWSVNLAQSLCVNTPVVSDWRHTSVIGDSWSVLAHSIEDMSQKERISLAMNQKSDYLKVIDDYKSTIERVSSDVFSH